MLRNDLIQGISKLEELTLRRNEFLHLNYFESNSNAWAECNPNDIRGC